MEVVVSKNLNIRVGAPSVNAPCYNYLVPGSYITVDGNLYKGEIYDGIDTWLKDMAGNYYWSGGIEQQSLIKNLFGDISDKWWLKNFNIPKLWLKGLTGKGVKIAILDTGIFYPHQDLNLDNNLFHNATKSSSSTNDFIGHGTHCVGIIKAFNNEFGSTGIAYNSSVYVCKITDDIFGDKVDYLIEGITWAISQNVDIISISNGSPDYQNDKLESAINNANDKGILILCAAGNKTSGYPDDHIYYPARYDFTVSVGGIQDNNQPLQDSILTVTNETTIFAPGRDILSTYKNNLYINLSGSSQATPFVAGVCALVLESKRIKNPLFKAKDIKKILTDNADNYDFGGIINPIKMVT